MSFTEQQIRDFWTKVNVANDNDCWEWTAARNPKGYGVKRVGGGRVKRNILAHRMAWILFNSEVPDGLIVCHRCDNPSCVNPAHLFLGTPKDNMDDKIAKGRGKNPPLAPLKFTAEQVEEIRAMYESGASFRSIGRHFSAGHNVIRAVVNGDGRYGQEMN